MPVEWCKRASKNYELRRVTPLNTHLKAYGGCKLTVTGQFRICVWRDDCKCQLDCKLVDKNVIRPLLGRNANVGMTIACFDNDALNKPQTRSSLVYALESTSTNQTTRLSINKETLPEKYPEVFSEGIRKLSGEYHILVKSN